jgi:ssRNA-specific RNase YbeY (16S rRNA maturation enzyme)
MTKILLALMLMMTLSLVSCGKSGSSGSGSSSETVSSQNGSGDTVEDDDAVTGAGTHENEATTAATTISTTSTVPALALSFKTNVAMMNFTAAQKAKYNKAIEIVKKVVKTESFRKKVLNFIYAGKKAFANNDGKSNSQIYQSVLDAAESLKPAKNNTMDLGVKMYYANNSVVGYTNPSITYINVNTKFFNQYAANQVAGNLFHEWLHKIGYDHDSSSTSRRPYSVPYAIGYIVRDLGKAFL